MSSLTITVTVESEEVYSELRIVGTAVGGAGGSAWEPAHGLALTALPGPSSASGAAAQRQYSATLRPCPAAGTELKVCASRAQGGPWEWMQGQNIAVPPAWEGGAGGAGGGGAPAQQLSVVWRKAQWEEAGLGVLAGDGYLVDFVPELRARQGLLAAALADIGRLGGMDAFSRGFEVYGFTRGRVGGVEGIQYREWAPGARAASLVGDFNAWDVAATPLTVDAFGVWSAFLPDSPSGAEAIAHNTFVRLSLLIAGSGGSGEQRVNRLPAYIRHAVRDERLNEYVGKYWHPPPSQCHVWAHPRPATATAASYAGHGACFTPVTPLPSLGVPPSSSSSSSSSSPPDPAAAGLRIYECHVGMAGEEGKVSTYAEFRDAVLPRIAAQGYNCVQLMAVMEHAYYGSFGYHVTSFLAPSSRFGTPEDLKSLVDAAHGRGLLVIMDCVHSHACKNSVDGLNELDGTEYQYFHAGARGRHEQWDSRLFDYSKVEVRRLLLSSLRLYADEFRFDGFRFDGVTSMMYTHHGLGVGFSGGYHEYFGAASVDGEAVCYLQLANTLLHSLQPPCLSIAEDVSGMPTLGRPVWEGGLGFDYRLAMAVPDVWIKLLKESRDEQWDMEALVWTLTNRRHQEKCIAYSESHDQALVGDKTIAFWLMDKEMYWHMSRLEHPRSPVIDRGIALHKMIRLLTCALGGEGWLGFIGNEFGHPEWLDFPREGNGWSYHYCRRQWSLVDNPDLLYAALARFEQGMHALGTAYPWLLPAATTFVSTKNNGDKVVAFERGTPAGTLLFAFNFHASSSYVDYRVAVPSLGAWGVALDSDWEEFGGYGRNARDVRCLAEPVPHNGRPCSISIYLPARTVIVMRLLKE